MEEINTTSYVASRKLDVICDRLADRVIITV